jgi:hypothetical protein
MCALLSSLTCRSIGRLSAYPCHDRTALASDALPPRTPCGWSRLRLDDPARRAGAGLLRSCVRFADGRRVVNSAGRRGGDGQSRQDMRAQPPVPVGSSVSASCAGSAERPCHDLPVRTPIPLCERPFRGEAPRWAAFIPASRLEDPSRPWGPCFSPSPRAVGIPPTPGASAQVWSPGCSRPGANPPNRASDLVAGQRIAP